MKLFKLGDDQFKNYPRLYQNTITDSMGDSAMVSGRIRRYANVLQPGDRVVASTDGLGPRGDGTRGLDRDEIEKILEQTPEAREAAQALVHGQVGDVQPDEYQDNIAVVVLDVN